MNPEQAMQTVQCGYCSGRGVNSNGSECEHCDCGVTEVPFDYVAAKETDFDEGAKGI